MSMLSANALEVLAEARAVALSLGMNYFYLDMGEYENISLSKTQRLHHSLARLIAVMQSYQSLTTEEQESIAEQMPFMISA